MFDKSDFLVFNKAADEKVADNNLPDHMLSFDHNTWTGYVRSTDDRKDDEFASHLKSICRG